MIPNFFKLGFWQKKRLIKLQNRIVEPRFADNEYRTTQNYVGEVLSAGYEKIHYISPKPKIWVVLWRV